MIKPMFRWHKEITEASRVFYILTYEKADSIYEHRIVFEKEEYEENRSLVAEKLKVSKRQLQIDAINCQLYVDQIWRHNGNKHLYKIVETSSAIKLNGVWSEQPTLTYRDLKTGIKYSRLLPDFLASFTRIN